MSDYNAAERAHVKAAARIAKVAEQQRIEVITSLMSSGPGRRYMLERLERCHIFASSFSGDALTTAFAEGERNIGLQDLNDIMFACPEQYVVMMEERNARNAAAERSRGQERGREFEGPDEAGGEPPAEA